jgi:hypothetical protein
MPLIDFLRKECRCFFLKSHFPFQLLQVSNEVVELPALIHFRSLRHHLFGILHGKRESSLKQWRNRFHIWQQDWQLCGRPKYVALQLSSWFPQLLFAWRTPFLIDIVIH